MYNIASERKRIDVTQAELAARLGVSQRTVSRWEQGRHAPNADEILKMARIFNCTSDYLLGLTDERRAVRAGLHGEELLDG